MSYQFDTNYTMMSIRMSYMRSRMNGDVSYVSHDISRFCMRVNVNDNMRSGWCMKNRMLRWRMRSRRHNMRCWMKWLTMTCNDNLYLILHRKHT